MNRGDSRPPPDEDSERGERGIALVAVLWVLVLLATLVLGFVADARTGLHLVNNDAESAAARAIADAGVTLAVLGAFEPAPAAQWRGDGSVHVFSYGGGIIRAWIEDESGKLDVNQAPIAVLRNLFQLLGSDAPDQLAAAVERQRQAAVAAAADPTTTGRPPPPAFLALDELRALPGMTPDLYRRVPDFLTVYSGQGSVDLQTAPVEVLRSLPNMDPSQVEAAIAARKREQQAATELGADAPVLPSSPLQIFTVVSQGRTNHGTVFVRRAVVRLTGSPQAPYRFLDWRAGGHEAPPG